LKAERAVPARTSATSANGNGVFLRNRRCGPGQQTACAAAAGEMTAATTAASDDEILDAATN
jgi:hypothetical protein